MDVKPGSPWPACKWKETGIAVANSPYSKLNTYSGSDESDLEGPIFPHRF